MDGISPTSSACQSPSHSASTSVDRVYRRILRQCVAAICQQNTKFHSAQAGALDALAALTHNFLSDACNSARSLCEHTGRSLVTPGDVHLALCNGGLVEMSTFADFLLPLKQRHGHTFNLRSQSPPQQPAVLRIADSRPHPTHFPAFLPSFPDPHSYIHTEVRDEIDSDYARFRRLSARNRREWEQSLVNYALSVHPTLSVFQELEKRLMFQAKEAVEERRSLHRRRLEQHFTTAQTFRKYSLSNVAATRNGENEAMLLDEEESAELPGDDDKPLDGGSTRKAIPGPKNNGVAGKDEIGARNSGTTGVIDPLMEGLFQPLETERSYVLGHIPPYCHILLPLEEPRPYLSALLSDTDADVGAGGAEEDEQGGDYFARILSKEMEGDEEDGDPKGANERDAMELGEQID